MEELFVSAKSLLDKENLAKKSANQAKHSRKQEIKNHVISGTGYEGERIEEFVKKLVSNHIKQLADIREIPNSRKPGFSKSKLIHTLANYDIKYEHFKPLGSPKYIRHQLREERNYDHFFQQYEDYLSGLENVLTDLEEYVAQGPTVLLCFEADHNLCHRKSVLSEMELRGFEIQHI